MFNWTEYFCTTSTFISTSVSPTHHTSREWLDNRALEAYFQIYLSHTLSVWSAFMLHCWLRADKYLERIFFFYWQTCSVNFTSLVLCLEGEWHGDVTKSAGGNCFRRCKCSVQCTHTTEIAALVDSPRMSWQSWTCYPFFSPWPCALCFIQRQPFDFANEFETVNTWSLVRMEWCLKMETNSLDVGTLWKHLVHSNVSNLKQKSWLKLMGLSKLFNVVSIKLT